MSSGLFLDLNLLFAKLLEWLKSNGINSYTNILSLLHAKINGDKMPPMSKHYLFQDFVLWIRKCACQVSSFKFNTNTKKNYTLSYKLESLIYTSGIIFSSKIFKSRFNSHI